MKYFLKIFRFILPLVYFLLVLAPPATKELLASFLVYSDKFELHKGSDLLIIFVIVMMINNKKLNEKILSVIIL